MTERVKVRMIARNKEKKKGKKGTKNGDRGKKKLRGWNDKTALRSK